MSVLGYSFLYQGILRIRKLTTNSTYTCIVHNSQCSRSTSTIKVIVKESENGDNVYSTYGMTNSDSKDAFVLTMVSTIFAFLLLATIAVVWHSFRTRTI